jgi:hypothetical protein
MTKNPFDNIESAHMYVRLLRQQVEEVEATVTQDIAAVSPGDPRHLDALRLVVFKLGELSRSLGASSRTLNDLRSLRRLLSVDGGDDAKDGRSEAMSTSSRP